MPDIALLTEIAVDVKYLRQSMDELKGDFKAHVAVDDDRFKPLENAYQQSIGRKTLWIVMMGLVSAASGYFGGHR